MPVLVGVAGGSASGKTTLCNRIISELSFRNCSVLSLDSFYKGGIPPEKVASYNFDHPDSLDFDLCYEVLKKLVQKKDAEIPVYSFVTHSRAEQWEKIKPCDIILFEGILALHDPRIVELMNLKIFVQCDDDIRLYRRLLRDVKERGRDVEGILYQYNTFVKPSFNDFIKPSMKNANIIVPGNSDNAVAINLIVDNLRSQVSRLEALKSTNKKPLDQERMLDSGWVDIITNVDTKAYSILDSPRILIPKGETVKNETTKIFNLFSKKFSKSLYIMCMKRFVSYDVKMMLRHYKESLRRYEIIHYDSDVAESIKRLKGGEIVTIIVPILDAHSDKEVRVKIENLCSAKKDLEIFVFAMFSEMNTMVELTEFKDNIHVINNVCLTDLKSLMKILNDNCRTRYYEFNNNVHLVDELRDICSAAVGSQLVEDTEKGEQIETGANGWTEN